MVTESEHALSQILSESCQQASIPRNAGEVHKVSEFWSWGSST